MVIFQKCKSYAPSGLTRARTFMDSALSAATISLRDALCAILREYESETPTLARIERLLNERPGALPNVTLLRHCSMHTRQANCVFDKLLDAYMWAEASHMIRHAASGVSGAYWARIDACRDQELLHRGRCRSLSAAAAASPVVISSAEASAPPVIMTPASLLTGSESLVFKDSQDDASDSSSSVRPWARPDLGQRRRAARWQY